MTDERIYRYPDGRTQRLGASLDDVPVANATDRTAPRREVVGLSGEVFGRYGEATIVRQADGREVVTWQPEDADYTEISRVAVEKMVAEVERLRNTVAAHEAYIRGQQAERDEALDAVRDATEKVAAAQREVSEARGALAEVARLRAAVAAAAPVLLAAERQRVAAAIRAMPERYGPTDRPSLGLDLAAYVTAAAARIAETDPEETP